MSLWSVYANRKMVLTDSWRRQGIIRGKLMISQALGFKSSLIDFQFYGKWKV